MKHNAKSFSNLLAELTTNDDVDILREELMAIEEAAVSSENFLKNDGLMAKVRPRILLAIQQDLNIFDADPRSYAREAMEVALSLPVMEVTLAYEPVPEGIKRLGEKLRSISGKPYLLSLIINPALLGGMVCVVNGEFRDYSMSAKLAALLKEMYPGMEEQ
jgi:hypothetical protein